MAEQAYRHRARRAHELRLLAATVNCLTLLLLQLVESAGMLQATNECLLRDPCPSGFSSSVLKTSFYDES